MEYENNAVRHGTYAAYTNKKCRCEECKTAAREYMRDYRKTESGRARSRLYTHIATKRNNKAAAWVKENHPDVWEKICSEISAK
jgi:hypothetical protein